MARKGYLRKITNTVPATTESGFTRMFDILECGHVKRVPTDMYGETNATKRRCDKCAKGLPVDDVNQVIQAWAKRIGTTLK